MNVSFEAHGSGPAVIFLHGVGSGKEGWRHQIDCVVGAGWRFVAIDGPGFGNTDCPEEEGFAPHISAVLQTMDDLDISGAAICGHSMGGMTAQEVYALHPDRVDALILSATSPAFGRPDGDFQKEFLRARFEPLDNGMTMADVANATAAQLVGPTPDDGAIDEIIDVMAAVSAEAYRKAVRALTTFDQRANLENIAIPTLLIAGDNDKNAPAPMMKKMASKIPGTNYVELSSTGHMAPIENSAAFNQHLTEFLKRIAQ